MISAVVSEPSNRTSNGLCEFKNMSLILVVLEKFNEMAMTVNAEADTVGDRGQREKIIKDEYPLTWHGLSLKILKLFTELRLAFEEKHTFKYSSLLFNLVEIVNKMHDINWKKNLDFCYGIDYMIYKRSEALDNTVTRFLVEVFQASGTWVPRNINMVLNMNMQQVLKHILDYISIAQKYTDINYLHGNSNENPLLNFESYSESPKFEKLCDFKLMLKIENMKQKINDSYLDLILEISNIINNSNIQNQIERKTLELSDMQTKVVQFINQYLQSIGYFLSFIKWSWVVIDEDKTNPIAKINEMSTSLLKWLESVILTLPSQFNILLLKKGRYPYDISLWKEGLKLAISCIENLDIVINSNQFIKECVKKIPSISNFDDSKNKSSTPKQIRKMLSKTCVLVSMRKKLDSIFNLDFEDACVHVEEGRCLINPVIHKENNSNLKDETESNILLEKINKNRKSSVMKYLLNELNTEYGSEKIYNLSKNDVVYVSESPKYATWDGLVNLIAPELKPPSTKIIRVFFLTFRLYGSSTKILHSLIEKFDESEFYKDSPLHIRIYNCFKIWLEKYYFHQSDYQILPILKEFLERKEIQENFSSVKGLRVLINEFLNNHIKKNFKTKNSKISTSKETSFFGKVSNKIIEKSFFNYPELPITYESSSKINIFKWDQSYLAESLTLFDSSYFVDIKNEDIISFFVKPSDKIRKIIDWNNRLSYFVIENILIMPSYKERAFIIKQLIKLADKLLKINNFNSLMSILSGLNNSSIRRLNLSWQSVSPKYLAIYENLNKLFDPSRNFKRYRNTLAKVSNSCVPFFGIFLSDLTFINEGNPTHVRLYPNLVMGDVINYTTSLKKDQISIINKYNFAEEIDVVNIDKFVRLTEVIDEIERLRVSYKNLNLDGNKLLVLKKEMSRFPLSKTQYTEDENRSLLEFEELKLSYTNNDYYYYSRQIEPPEKRLDNSISANMND